MEHPLTATRVRVEPRTGQEAQPSAFRKEGDAPRRSEEARVDDWRGLAHLRDGVCSWIERRGVDANEAQDVAHEALVRASRYRSRLHDERLLRPWVLSIARNVLVDRQRRAQRELKLPVASARFERIEGREADPALDPEPDEIELVGERLPRGAVLSELEDALHELRDQDREILRCYYGFYGAEATCREAASAWNLAPEVVKMRLFRARRRLLRSLRLRLGLGPLELAPKPRPEASR